MKYLTDKSSIVMYTKFGKMRCHIASITSIFSFLKVEIVMITNDVW